MIWVCSWDYIVLSLIHLKLNIFLMFISKDDKWPMKWFYDLYNLRSEIEMETEEN